MFDASAGTTTFTPEDFGMGRLFWLTHEAIVGADLERQRIVLWNPSAERVFGWSAAEALGLSLDTLVPAELREAHHAGIDRFRTTGVGTLVGGGPVEVPALAKDGTRRVVSLTLTAVDTGTRHVLAVVRDVTEQKAAEDELRRTNEAMQSFVAAASHDLRSPLSSVIGYARLLSEQGEGLDEERRRSFADAVLRAGERAARLVDDLLTFSRIRARAVDARPEDLVLAPLVREAAGDLSAHVEVEVDVEIDIGDDIEVRADRDHFCRILVNLLVNAARYGRPPVRVSAASADRHVELRVQDDGDGVPTEFLASLFEPFARAAAVRGVPGTGLGLSIVKGLVEANDGELRYEPGSPGGACFVVRLPRVLR